MDADSVNAVNGSPLPGFCDLQIMGHVRHVCYVSEVEIAGATFLKVEPLNAYTAEAERTVYYRPESVYSLTPMPEEAIRAQIKRLREARARCAALTAPALTAVTEETDEDEDDRDGVGDDNDDIPL